MIYLSYLDPTNKDFIQSTQTFKTLERWQKVASVIVGIAGGILTPFLLSLGSIAAFRWVVEKFHKPCHSTPDQCDDTDEDQRITRVSARTSLTGTTQNETDFIEDGDITESCV